MSASYNLPPLINIIEISSKAPKSPQLHSSPKLDDIFSSWNKSAQDGTYRDWSSSCNASPVINQTRSFSFCYGSPFTTSGDAFSASSPNSFNNIGFAQPIRKHSVPSNAFRNSPYSPPHSPHASYPSYHNNQSQPQSPNTHNGKKMRLNFSKHTTQILKDWLFTNLAHPFPTEQQKLNLSMLTGLSIEQINNWFINGRRRLLTIRKDQNYRKYFKIKN